MNESATPPPPPVPAGWYGDNEGRVRWWNGNEWTDAYAPLTAQTMIRQPFNPFSVLGFVLALVSAVIFASGIFAVGVGALGLVASIMGYADKVRRGRGFAVAGIVVSGVAILVGLLAIVRTFTNG